MYTKPGFLRIELVWSSNQERHMKCGLSNRPSHCGLHKSRDPDGPDSSGIS